MNIAHKVAAAVLTTTLVTVPALGLMACSPGQDTSQVASLGVVRGASQNESQTSSQTASQTPVTVVGVQDEAALKVMLTNGLVDDIQAIAVRAKGVDQWPQSLLADDALIVHGTEVTLYVPADTTATAYELRVIAGGRTYEFTEIPLANIAAFTLKTDDAVAYVDYQLTDGTRGSTKDAVAAAALEKEKAEVEARTNAEEYGESAYEEAAPVPSQSEDECVGGIVLREV